MAKVKDVKSTTPSIKVGQSMLKDYRAYHAGEECGLRFNSKHIAKTYPNDTGDAAALGHYLEFLLFKTVPTHMKKEGRIPQPEFMVSALKDVTSKKRTMESLTVDDMLAPYREVHRKAKIVQQYLDEMKVTIVRTDTDYQNEWGRGLVDVEMKGEFFGDPNEEVIVDLKYSGLTDNIWDDWGFGFEKQNQLDYHGTQGRQYHLLTGKRFFFLLVSSSAKNDTAEFVECKFSDESLIKHRDEALYVREKVEFEKSIGFVARPNLIRCNGCMLKATCSSRAKVPSIRVVNFG